MQAFVITINGLKHSELGAENCIQSARQFGITVKPFKAITKFDAFDKMKSKGIFINKRIYQGVSDGELRDYAKPGEWWLTTPEIGCLMSHFELWEMSVLQNQPLAIFEHDAVLTAPLPTLPKDALAINLHIPKDHFYTTIAYIISPQAAAIAVNEVLVNGAQPADELLWKAALGGKPILVCRESLVACQDNGVSTIQYAHHGKKQSELGESDPWSEYRPTLEN